ncbi:MAG: hypothetical protein SGARI_000146 [Bacillariaceae sp.]
MPMPQRGLSTFSSQKKLGNKTNLFSVTGSPSTVDAQQQNEFERDEKAAEMQFEREEKGKDNQHAREKDNQNRMALLDYQEMLRKEIRPSVRAYIQDGMDPKEAEAKVREEQKEALEERRQLLNIMDFAESQAALKQTDRKEP